METSTLAVTLPWLGSNPDHTELLTPRVSWITPRRHSTFNIDDNNNCCDDDDDDGDHNVDNDDDNDDADGDDDDADDNDNDDDEDDADDDDGDDDVGGDDDHDHDHDGDGDDDDADNDDNDVDGAEDDYGGAEVHNGKIMMTAVMNVDVKANDEEIHNSGLSKLILKVKCIGKPCKQYPRIMAETPQ